MLMSVLKEILTALGKLVLSVLGAVFVWFAVMGPIALTWEWIANGRPEVLDPYHRWFSAHGAEIANSATIAVVLLASLAVGKYWQSKTSSRNEHTPGSVLLLALLFAFLAAAALLSTHVLLSIVLAAPLWLVVSAAAVRLIARGQQPQREMRSARQDHEKVTDRLARIEARTGRLQRERWDLATRHQAPLARRAELEAEAERLVGLDPANLRLKADALRSQAGSFSEDGLRERMRDIDREIKQVGESRNKLKEKLSALRKEGDALASKRRTTERQLQQLEARDPANVRVRLDSLRSAWQGLSPAELEAVQAGGEVARLLKQLLLLELRSGLKSEEIRIAEHGAGDTLAESILLLEKHLLEQEDITRSLGRDEPQLLRVDSELRELDGERHRLDQEKAAIGARVEQAANARTRLEVGRGVLAVNLLCGAVALAGLGVTAPLASEPEEWQLWPTTAHLSLPFLGEAESYSRVEQWGIKGTGGRLMAVPRDGTSLHGRIVFVRQDPPDPEFRSFGNEAPYLYAISPDGTAETKIMPLFPPPYDDGADLVDEMAISPDGSKIALRYAYESSRIYIMSVEGETWSWYSFDLGLHSRSDLEWSPDGSQLAVSAHCNVYTVRDDGTGLRQLTSDGRQETAGRGIVAGEAPSEPPCVVSNSAPKWLPNGRQVLFLQNRSVAAEGDHSHYEQSMYTIDADGTNLTRISPHLEADLCCNYALSPDGSTVAFEREGVLYAAHLDPGAGVTEWELARGFDVGGYGVSPEIAWSPDGKQLAFEGNEDIYTVNTAGSGLRPLVQTAKAHNYLVAWVSE